MAIRLFVRRTRWLSLLLALLLAPACTRHPDPLPGFPPLILWSWERSDDLRFLDPDQAAVAFLARTITWRDGHVVSHPRLQPLRFPPGIVLMAVVRMESHGPPLPDRDAIAAEIAALADLKGVRAVQIDFDARQSEREWYAGVIRKVRSKLGARLLTITALASWCEGDPWIRGLPVDAAVPMLFRMGAGERRTGRDFSVPLCRSTLGVSTDELPGAIPGGHLGERRLFVFNPAAWTAESYRGVVELVRRWR